MTAREAQWRRRARKLIALARDAECELLAKTIRYSAIMAVLTPEENAALTVRIKARNAETRAVIAEAKAKAAPVAAATSRDAAGIQSAHEAGGE